jgi:hypothetical protein
VPWGHWGADADTTSIQGVHQGAGAVTGARRKAMRLPHGSTAKKWASGARRVPEPVAIMLRLLQSGGLTVERLESVAKPAKGGRK